MNEENSGQELGKKTELPDHLTEEMLRESIQEMFDYKRLPEPWPPPQLASIWHKLFPPEEKCREE